MNTQIEDFAEEQGRISFIEYTPTGIFILKIEKRQYRGTQIQSQVFKIGDEVRLLYNKRTKFVYAVLNDSKQILFLNEDIMAVEPLNYLHFIKKACRFTVAMILFLAFAYPLFQYFMDGTFYYIDTIVHLLILACILCIGRFFFEIIHSKNENKLDQTPHILEMFHLPRLSGRMLQSFKLMNGYFFEFVHLYDFKKLGQLRVEMNDQEIEHYLAEKIQKMNQYGLNQVETDRCQLALLTEELTSFEIKNMQPDRDNPDPFQEVKFKVLDKFFYGYFDEFPFTQGRQIQVIYSCVADLNGCYAWLVYDQILYLEVDEDIIEKRKVPLFKNNTNGDFSGFSVFVSIGLFLCVILFGFLYAIFLAGILGMLYFYGKFCYSIYLKMENKRNIHGYVFQQVSELIPSINLNTFDQYEYVRCFNQKRVENSRTGFRKEFRAK